MIFIVQNFYMICPAISDIYYRFSFYENEPKIFSSSLGAYKNVRTEGRLPLSEEKVQQRLEDVVNYIIQPIFDKATTIIGLDNFVNGWLSKQPLSYIETIKNPIHTNKSSSERRFLTPETFKGSGAYYYHKQLILARLANNPHYEKLKVFFEASKVFEPSNKELVTEWPKLVQYLEEEINPETFWQQYALLKAEEKRLEEERIQQLITQFNLNPEQEVIPVSDQWYDAKENLIWQRCCMGEHWQDGKLIGHPQLMNWDEMNACVERFKDTGWRLPSFQELITLTLTKPIGYVTKNGFDYYDEVKRSFIMHWITPYNPYSPQVMPNVALYIVTVSNGGIHSSKEKNDPDFKGYLRLVKTAQ